jgi:hypothetical protein
MKCKKGCLAGMIDYHIPSVRMMPHSTNYTSMPLFLQLATGVELSLAG